MVETTQQARRRMALVVLLAGKSEKMGDRTSIQFVEKQGFRGEEELSVVVCDHWGGEEFPKLAQKFVQEYGSGEDKGPFAGMGKGISTPHTRRDIPYFTVEFIQWCADKVSVYVADTQDHVDNSNNGNYVIDVHTGEVVRHEIECHLCGERGWDEKLMKKVKHPVHGFTLGMCPGCAALSPEERLSAYYSSYYWTVPGYQEEDEDGKEDEEE
jgi:hypothetical protein